MFCREQVAQLRRETDAIHARGAEVVVIGNGNPNFARAFRDETGLRTPLYVDTRRESYRALGMKRGLGVTLFAPHTWSHAVRSLRAGHRQTRPRGDAWQLGGVLVVRPGGEVAYQYLSREAGDHPPVAEIIAALH